MVESIAKAVCAFPPRPVTDGERQLLLDWIEATGDFSGFVSERRSDDPAIYRRIVILRRATRQRLYVIHCPQGSNWWMVTSATEGEDVGYFATLRAALQFIRPLAPQA